ncbi:MAG: HEAT repeat domain-containing protein [Planctomycetota bacterium]
MKIQQVAFSCLAVVSLLVLPITVPVNSLQAQIASTDNRSIIQTLADPDPLQRIAAIKRIETGGEGRSDVIEMLVKAIGDDDIRVRTEAANAIGSLELDPDIIVPIVVRVMNEEEPVYASRMLELALSRGEKAVPYLNAALRNEHAAYWGCLGIAELGVLAAETVPELVVLLNRDLEETLHIQALLAAAEIGSKAKSAQSAVIAALKNSESPAIRSAAAYAVGSIGIVDASDIVTSLRTSDDPMLKMVAYWALSKINPSDAAIQTDAIDALVGGLLNDNRNIRLAAAKGLQRLEADLQLVEPKLEAVLSTADPTRADELVDAFSSLGEAAAAPSGRALANQTLRPLAIRVLEQLGPEASGASDAIVASLKTASGEDRERLQALIIEIGPKAVDATDELVRSLTDSNSSIRITALIALQKFGKLAERATNNTLAVMRNASSDFERILASWTTAAIANPSPAVLQEIVGVLIEGLSFTDRRVQSECATTLGRLGPSASQATNRLIEIVNDPTSSLELREIATTALQKIQP